MKKSMEFQGSKGKKGKRKAERANGVDLYRDFAAGVYLSEAPFPS
jgi:hypothetical protein